MRACMDVGCSVSVDLSVGRPVGFSTHMKKEARTVWHGEQTKKTNGRRNET